MCHKTKSNYLFERNKKFFQNVSFVDTFSFLSRGIILGIELPWPESLANIGDQM